MVVLTEQLYGQLCEDFRIQSSWKRGGQRPSNVRCHQNLEGLSVSRELIAESDNAADVG